MVFLNYLMALLRKMKKINNICSLITKKTIYCNIDLTKKKMKKSFKYFSYPMCYERVQNFSIVIIVNDQRAIYDDITLPELEARKTQNCDLGRLV